MHEAPLSRAKHNFKKLLAEILGFLMLIVFGLYFAHYIEIKGFWDAFNTKDWHEIQGTVVDSAVKTIERQRSGSGGSRIYFSHRLSVEYTYEVNGKTYSANWVHYQIPFTVFDTQQAAKEAQTRFFKPGSQAKIYVNPVNPQEAYLLRGPVAGQATRRLLLGYSFILLGGFAIVKTLYDFRKQRHEHKRG